MLPLKEKILSIVQETVETLGYINVENKLMRGNGANILKVVVYKNGDDISMENCSSISNVILRRLDLDIPGFSEHYDLIIESPGVERKLRSLEEINIFKDREIRFVIKNQVQYGLKDNVLIGKVEDIEKDILKIQLGKQKVMVNWNDISSAKLYFDIKKYL